MMIFQNNFELGCQAGKIETCRQCDGAVKLIVSIEEPVVIEKKLIT